MKYTKMLLFLVCMIQIDIYNMDTNKQLVEKEKENQNHHKQIMVQNPYNHENYNQGERSKGYNFFSSLNIFNFGGEINQNNIFDFNSYMKQKSTTWQDDVFDYYRNNAIENNVALSTSAIWVKRESINIQCLFQNEPNHECNTKCRKYNTDLIEAIFELQVKINKKKILLTNMERIQKFIRQNIESELETLMQKKNKATLEILEQNNQGHKAAEEAEKKKQNENLQNRPWYEKYPRAACAVSFFASFVIFHPTLCINFCVNSASLFFEWLAAKKTA